MKNINRGNYIRAIFWTITTLLFCLWTKSLWWLIAIPLFIDLYTTRFLPWGFWKGWKNKTLKTIMDWIDAIVFALAAVYVINIYFFQNYQIPSSSLEKSLLVGDFLFVSKVSYGPRVPMTPLSFPLAQHTMPMFNCKSYFDKPHWDYKRVKGFGHVKRNDIVVFNFPAGDSVPSKFSNPDYYSLKKYIAKQNNVSLERAKEHILSHPEEFGEMIYRPVDRRENYVKRCVGLPGDSLKIVNNQVFINNKILQDRPGVQYNYYIQTKGGYFNKEQLRSWHISNEDREILSEKSQLIKLLGLKNNNHPVYHIPATKKVIEEIKNNPLVDKVVLEPDTLDGYAFDGGILYPLSDDINWTRDNYGPIYIPKKGKTISLTHKNIELYSRVIVNYEHHDLKINNGKIMIDGKVANSYTFEMDYYWMMGDNRHNSADSRYWGFVPEDHIVGKPIRIWLSLDKDRSWFNGKIRWNRFFKNANSAE